MGLDIPVAWWLFWLFAGTVTTALILLAVVDQTSRADRYQGESEPRPAERPRGGG